MPRIQQVIETFEAECAELRERLAWLEMQLKEFQAHRDAAAAEVPARSLRRATARRASRRRAAARSRKLDTKASIVEFQQERLVVLREESPRALSGLRADAVPLAGPSFHEFLGGQGRGRRAAR